MMDGINQMFTMICIDEFSSNQIASLQLRKVPAIVISQQNRKPEIYEGAMECSKWLKMFTYNWKMTQKQRVTNQIKMNQKARYEAVRRGGAIEFIEAEMDGIGDDYAYVATDLCQPKSFAVVGSEETNNIATPQLQQNKLDKHEMTKQMNKLNSKIQKDTLEFRKLMEQKQIQAVVTSGI